MTFKELSHMNKMRKDAWHKNQSMEWSTVDWSNAAAGEMGECCNAVKKYRRLETNTASNNNPQSIEEAKTKIAEEIAGTFLYLDLLADHLGLNMEDIIKHEFNRVSVRENLPFLF